MKYQLPILIFLFARFSELPAQSERLDVPKVPLTRYFEPADYGGGIQNWSFTQDTNGLLYIANNLGLLEFDGSTWTVYPVPNSTRVRSVYIDHRNRIYVGGQGQIGYFEKTREGHHFISLLERLPEGERIISEVWKIIPHNQKLYFNTSNKLLVLDDEKFYAVPLPGKIMKSFRAGRRLIVQIENKGLFEDSPDGLVMIRGTSSFREEIIAILEKGDGFLFFTVPGNVYHYSEPMLREILIPGLRRVTVNTCLRMSSGKIAVGTQNNGLMILDSALCIQQYLTRGRGLNNQTVHSLMEDDFGNLWTGLNNGISYVQFNSPLSLINEEVGLEGTGYGAAYHAGEVYLGTNNGLFKRVAGKMPVHYELVPGSEGQVYNISIVQDDIVLNHHRGAFQISGDKLVRIHSTGSWKFMPTYISGKVIGGGYNGIYLFEKTDGLWSMVKQVEGIRESSRIMEFENDSTLWMTHGYKGAYRISFDSGLSGTKKVDFFGSEHGFPSNFLISVYQLDQNLIFTGARGIYKYNRDTKYFDANPFLIDKIGNEHVSKITSNASGDIFFLTNRQLGYLKRESFGTYRKELNIFKRINKFLNDDLENITILDDRNVLIGAKEGFIHFDPKQQYKLVEDFHVVLKHAKLQFPDSSVTILGEFLDGLTMEKNNSIKFQFAAPYFDGLDDLQYSYRLAGFDDNWSEWSATTLKEYTNLPARAFTFQVKARNTYEKESKILSKSFKILPKWYQSGWIYLGYVFSGIIVFGSITYYWERKHKKEKKMLYESREVIKSKNEELFRASRQSKAEIENLRNEKLQSEINYKNNELTSVTMHLLKKSEFVNRIRKRIEAIVQENSNSKEELKRIIKTIARNIQEDDSWDQFAHHFDQVHGDFLKNISSDKIKLTPQETKLATYLRMNMSSKEIANLTNVSVRGVELARYRLRKKLKLKRNQRLVEYLLQI